MANDKTVPATPAPARANPGASSPGASSPGASSPGASSPKASGERAAAAGTEERVIPVVEEKLQVGKREVERGGVRVESRVVERAVEENVALREEHVHVERRAVDRAVQPGDMAAFREGTIEVVERAEEAVVAKEARVVEEVVVGKNVEQRVERIQETLKHTEVGVEKLGGKLKGGQFKEFSSYEADLRKDYDSRYASSGVGYDRYMPLYRYGYNLATSQQYASRDWATIEPEAQRAWEEHNPGTWAQVKAAVRLGWAKVTGKV